MKKLLFICFSLITYLNFAGGDAEKLAARTAKFNQWRDKYKKLGDKYYNGEGVVRDFLAAKVCYDLVDHDFNYSQTIPNNIVEIEKNYHVPVKWLPKSVLTQFALYSNKPEIQEQAYKILRDRYWYGDLFTKRDTEVGSLLLSAGISANPNPVDYSADYSDDDSEDSGD